MGERSILGARAGTEAKDVNPENYYSGGAYVSLPFGNVRLYPYPTVPLFQY